MKLYNTLTRKKEEFKPITKGAVSMYHCGPTVYDYAHIGNFRSYVMADILRRTFEYKNFKVTQVMNITDVDDKTIRRAQEKGIPREELAKRYTKIFLDDLSKLNIHIASENLVRATDFIGQMVSRIEELLKKGFAYKGDDGSVYFKISESKNYGVLAGLENMALRPSGRVLSDEYSKEGVRDFVLWKAWNESDGDTFWKTSLGKGRPGWHIECSAMSMAKLGESFDIHTGGIDLIFPHHTNEIAQSEAVTGKPFVHYWLHNEFVSVNGEKMSKSKGNIITLRDLEEKGYDPLAYRYWLLTAHYRTPVNFTWEALKGAKEAIGRLGLGYAFLGKDFGIPLEQYLNRFEESIENDMNTPQAVAIAHELLDEKKISATDKKSTLLKMDSILGFNLSSYVLAEEKRKKDLPEEVRRFAEEREAEREQAKKTKNWKKSDELREKIRKAGYEVIDFPDGQRFYPFK